jgi:hypothetical protein
MKITSEVISRNLNRLESAQREFPSLSEYQKLTKGFTPLDWDRHKSIRGECISYGLLPYVDFIDFIIESKLNGQEVFYKKKIKNKEFQEILVKNAIDDNAKKSFNSKTKRSFETLINSKRWETLTGNSSSRRKSYSNNLKDSDAIIANFVIQNEIEVGGEFLWRLNRHYLQLIPSPDLTIKNEIKRTKEIIDFIIDKLSESGTDFRKVNHDHLTKTLSLELKNRMLTIDPGEKIKCIEISPETTGLTIDKFYNVISKTIDYGILKVTVFNDNERNQSYNYRLFEKVSILRNSALDELLNNL